MIIKAVRNATPTSPEQSRTIECANVTKTIIGPESVAARAGSPVGIIVECGAVRAGDPMTVIRIPADADVVYVMNDQGVTIDRILFGARR